MHFSFLLLCHLIRNCSKRVSVTIVDVLQTFVFKIFSTFKIVVNAQVVRGTISLHRHTLKH